MKFHVIVPCYNEADRLLTDEFLVFARDNPGFSFLFVNDGSTDHSSQILGELSGRSDSLTLLDIPENKGKAAAVRAGMLHALEHADAEFIGFLDADLAIPLLELKRMTEILKDSQTVHFAFMSKQPGKDGVRQPLKRFLMGRTLATVTRMSLRLGVYDTQCGCKLMHRSLVQEVAGEPFISPWLFDIEIFHRLIRSRGRDWFGSHALEIPLHQLVERGESRVRANALFHLPIELWTIHRTYRRS